MAGGMVFILITFPFLLLNTIFEKVCLYGKVWITKIPNTKTLDYQNMTQKHEMSKCYWKNGTANRLAQHNVATKLQFVEKQCLKSNKTAQ